jgi:hypothetical protein
MDGWTDEWMDGRTDGQMWTDGWMDRGWTDGWMDGRTDGRMWTDGWMDGWKDVDGWMDGRMDGCGRMDGQTHGGRENSTKTRTFNFTLSPQDVFASGGSTVVEHSTTYLEIEGSNPAMGPRNERSLPPPPPPPD